jgi:hypothetical protein
MPPQKLKKILSSTQQKKKSGMHCLQMGKKGVIVLLFLSEKRTELHHRILLNNRRN